MARTILNHLNYTFNPATRTIVLPVYVPRERLVLITNVSTNTVIYNFSDSTLGATSYTATGGQTFPQLTAASQLAGQTTIVLSFNTASMSADHKLQILIDEYEDKMIPAETYIDPANKFRVSTPQSLIDTDFELGLQTTKWEFTQYQNGAPSIFTRPTDTPLQPVFGGLGFGLTNVAITGGSTSVTISGLTMPVAPAVGSFVYVVDAATSLGYSAFRYTVTAGTTSSVTFTVSPAPTTGTVPLVVIGSVPGTAANPSYAAFNVTNEIASTVFVGTPITLIDTFDEAASDGTFTVAAVNAAARSFGFLPKSVTANFNVLQRPNTVIYVGAYYNSYAASANIPVISVVSDGARTMTVTTVSPHGQFPGAPIFVNNTTQINANGPWYILSVPSPTTFTYATFNTVTGGNITQVTTNVFLRPEGSQTHRPNDGGVQITAGNNLIGSQVIRQTRRYFRYQSGKGIQFSTAFTFKPNYDIVSLAVSGQLAVVTTDQDHGLKPGCIVRITGLTATNVADQNVYNNTFVVRADQPITAKTFAIGLSSSVSDTNPGGQVPVVEVVEAKGYAARAGLFDDGNGMFWEYDGATLNVVRRNSTAILRGDFINVLTGNTLVLGGTRTRFTKQIVPGDRIFIRGTPYTVASVTNDYTLTISPAYRAATPSTASGTSGLPYSTLVAATGQTQTINIQVSINASSIASGTGSGGGAGQFSFTAPFSRTANTTISSGGTVGSRSVVVASATGLIPGQLVIGTGLPANTYVDSSYVSGSTTVPLTRAMTAGSSGSYDFYTVPSPGMVVSGTGITAASDTQATTVASINFTTSGGANTTGTVFITQPMTAGAGGAYTFGAITANTPTNVIALATTFGISPGMVLTGTAGGTIPGNCIVAFVQNQGSGIVLNQPINLATTFTNGSAITFTTAHNLYAITAATGGASTPISSTSVTMVSAAALSGVQIGSYITSATPGQFFPIGTYVTGVSGSTITTSQATTASIPGSTNLVFGSRVNVIGASQLVVNGTWPVSAVTASTITFQTTTAATSGTVSVFGTTRIFGEDFIARKSIVRDVKIPQLNWNLDTLDGRGPSGFNLDPTKAQMIFMDYTWYGEGFARWGVRAVNGDVIYCHKLQHGNVQYQAYMRTGNLPGRFELANLGANATITANIAATGFTISPSNPGTINVFDASKYFVPFTDSLSGTGKNGEVNIEGEYFFYTGLATTTGPAPWAVGDNGITSVATLGAVSVSNGRVVSIALTSGGSGYTSSPPIVISGPGGGARAVAHVVNGSVVSVVVTDGGSGYTVTPNVFIGPNQLTGVVREPNAVSVGNLVGAVSTAGSTAITSVTNAASYYVGMRLGAIAAFNNLPVTITGVSGPIVYVDQPAVTSGSITIGPIAKGVPTAAAHFANNSSGNAVATALNTNQQVVPATQHWGVSVMMDGRFDNDKSYVFTTPRQTAAVVNANQTAPLLSIRVSPSVSLGFARNFGVRDIVNRMQLNLYAMDVYTSGQFLITVRYNCSSNTFVAPLWSANQVGSGSLAQVIYHNSQDIVTGGDVIVAFYATNAGTGIFSVTQQDLSIVKDLGNAIVGGDGVYPDGPDVITVFATNLSTTAPGPIYSRISWTEAQA